MSPIERLQLWARDQCDGDWEHGAGIRIETLDNPGWIVTVDLSKTSAANADVAREVQERSDNDWVQFEVTEGSFVGCGGLGNLSEILERLFEIIDR